MDSLSITFLTVSEPLPNERKRKTAVYFEGKETAVRFENAMRNILSVPKEVVVRLEKQKSRKTR